MIGRLFWLINVWFATRQWRRLPLAAFSLLTGTGLSVTLFVAVNTVNANRVAKYHAAAGGAVAAGRYEDADLFLRKAVYSGDASHDTVFRLGLIAERTGDLELARIRMQSIAPVNKHGFGKAHQWLANDIRSDSSPRSAVTQKYLVHHLSCAIADDPENSDLHASLAQVHLEANHPEAAIPHLNASVRDHPELAVSLARIVTVAGNVARAISIGELASRQYMQRLDAHPSDIESRLKLAELRVFLEQWAGAETVLREGMSISDDERLKTALSKVYVFRADLYQRQQPRSFAEQLTLLESAVQLTPDDAGVAQRLTNHLTFNVPLSDAALESVTRYWADVLKREPNSQEPHLWLGYAALRANDATTAIEHFVLIVDTKPELLLPLARIYRSQQDNEKADEYAMEAEATYADIVSTNPDDVHTRVLWADAKSFQGDWTGSVAVLNQGLARENVTGQLHLALSKVYTAWGQQLGQSADAVQKRVHVLGLAIELASGNLTAHQQLGDIIEKGSAKEAAAAKAEVERLIASGKSSGLGHMILGGVAVRRDDLEAARLHFEQAHHALPEMLECQNNLAWALVRTEPVDSERALELINQALEARPNNPEFLETRGEVYVHLERYSNAIADLESALSAFPDRTRTHELLATAYEHAGSIELAKRHRELSQKRKVP